MPSYPDYDRIRKKMKEKRLEKGMRQERLAEIVDVSSAYISRLETGRDNPSLHMLYQLAVAFECSVCDFLVAGGEESSDYLWGEMLSRLQRATPEQRKKIIQIMDLVLDSDQEED